MMRGISLLLAVSLSAAANVDEGIAAFRQGRYSAALNQLTAEVQKNPANQKAQVFLALTQAAQNNCESALPALLRNLTASDDALAELDGLATAKCQQAAGDTSGALQTLQGLGKRFPKDADVLYLTAKFHMTAFNDATLAMFQRAPASYRVHQLSAEIFEVQRQYDAAVDEYRKAIDLNRTAPDLHFRLGRAILMRSHDPKALEEARQSFEAERRLNPEDAATEYELGQIAQVSGNRGEAAGHFRRALALAPQFAEAMVELGKIQTQAKQYGDAIPTLQHAVTLQPENESAHYALMLAYRDSGQPDKARAEKATLDKLQRPPEGEFTEFLKKLGEKPQQP